MSARDRILGLLHRGAPAPRERLYAASKRPPASSRPATADLVSVFGEALEAAGGRTVRLEGESAGAFLSLLRTSGGGRAGVEDGLDRVPGGRLLLDALESAGFRIETVRGDTSPALLASLDAGVTTADLAIAETGTLIERPSPARPRALSLLPPLHVALLQRARIVAGLEDALALRGADRRGEVWITGPSRTADIEKVLTVGVHGPGTLIVCVTEESVEEGE